MANTFTSRDTLKTKLLAAVGSATTADQIVKLSRSIEKANLDDDADLETALDTKVSAMAASASTADIEKLAFGVKKLRTPPSAATPTSSMVAEGSSNLYVTDSRVRSSFSASGDLSYNAGTGVLSYTALPDALTVYATVADLPASGVAAGAKGIVEENKKLYIFTGASWVGVGLVDQKPNFTTTPDGSYALTPGADTVITLAATDPQGDAITYSYQVTAGALGGTTVSQADNVFTITGSSNSADAGSFSLSFTASDGTNVSTTTPSEFTVNFGIDWSSINTTPVVTVTAPEPKVQWGRSGAISGDYFCIADSENGGSYVGTLYIYRTADGVLMHSKTGTVSNGQQGVDNNNNGPCAMAGDYIAISSGYYMGQDQVKIYQASTGNLVGTITRPSILSNGDYFGTSVKMNEDASLLVVSAPFYGGNRGRVFVYNISDKNNIPDGNTFTILQSPTNGQGEYFGESVSITGSTILTSSTKMPHKAYLFNYYTQGVIATMERPGGYASGRFGRNVHVFDNDGSPISAIGCPTTTVGGQAEAGVVHVYDNTGSLIRSIENPNPTYSAWFGCVVRVVSSDTIVISERSNDDDGSGNNAGKVFIYSLTDGSLLSSLSNPYADGGPTQNTNMYRQFGFTMDVDPTTGKILVVDRHSRGYIFEA